MAESEIQANEQTGQMPGGQQTEASARRFIEALRALEERRDLDPLVALHAEGCDISNVVSPRTFRGIDGAREFWSSYRATFGDLRSDFRTVIAAGNRAALEWTSTGTSTVGHPIEYDGVSVIEFEGGKVARFRAYFDPAELGQQL